ncbi:MAG: alpha-D-ribose 1-methylphosphonate 5-triphosphate diphosphatase [Acidocella sp.]|nr:alpha-D-ribose 1-methylphosphonate 5-triphosphate diphosphatase [Acidocella sp.]
MSIFSNARLILPEAVLHGGLAIEHGRITGIGEVTGGVDCEGDFLLPGLIDLHTDNLERQVLPRNNARWPSRSALAAHDSQCVAAGITTVFDALCLGDVGFEAARNDTFLAGLEDLRALSRLGALKAEHVLHLRCELPAAEMPRMLEEVIGDPLVRLLSIMDHTPGLGQYADAGRYRALRAAEGYSATEIDAVFTAQLESHHKYAAANRALVLALAAAQGLPVASHDDRTSAEITRNAADGIGIAEFPVSMEAARAARHANMQIIAGAPNIVRGGSHSGNVAVLDLVREGLVDALASDYVPASMLEAAFIAAAEAALPLHAAIALITSGPAEIAGLTDRGQLTPGLRADFIQVRVYGGLPVVRGVWRAGQRIG